MRVLKVEPTLLTRGFLVNCAARLLQNQWDAALIEMAPNGTERGHREKDSTWIKVFAQAVAPPVDC
jgi:hypothetical protein